MSLYYYLLLLSFPLILSTNILDTFYPSENYRKFSILGDHTFYNRKVIILYKSSFYIKIIFFYVSLNTTSIIDTSILFSFQTISI